jgi:hypothetical protein
MLVERANTSKRRRMKCETFREAPPVARSARSVLLHVSTHRSERNGSRDSASRYQRLAGCIALQAMPFSAARSDGDGDRLGEREAFERAYQIIHQIAQTLFDAIGQRLLGSLLFITHAQRLFFSMGAEAGVSTAGRAFVMVMTARTARVVRAPTRAKVLHTCMSI